MIRIFFLTISLLGFGSWGWAQEQFGVGVIVGAPTGFSGAYSLNDKSRIDFALGYSLADDVHYHIHSDYLFLKPKLFQIDNQDIDLYFGVGARIKDRDTDNNDDDFRLGIRGPMGLHYQFEDPNVEIFGEIALIFDFIEKTDVDFNLGLGARFWF